MGEKREEMREQKKKKKRGKRTVCSEGVGGRAKEKHHNSFWLSDKNNFFPLFSLFFSLSLSLLSRWNEYIYAFVGTRLDQAHIEIEVVVV